MLVPPMYMTAQVHQEYLNRIHDRCFLHPSASMLREAVNLVLLLGVELRDATLSDFPIHTRTLLAWEEKYTRCHTFLASTLQVSSLRSSFPFLNLFYFTGDDQQKKDPSPRGTHSSSSPQLSIIGLWPYDVAKSTNKTHLL